MIFKIPGATKRRRSRKEHIKEKGKAQNTKQDKDKGWRQRRKQGNEIGP